MIGVVGATPSGLAAAYGLARRGHDVRVFESSDRADDPVGVPVSFARPRDDVALELLAELGLSDRLEWGPIRTAMYADGTVHPVDAPWEFLAYPPLSLVDTARLATVQSGVDCRGFPRRRPRFDAYEPTEYADVPAEEFVRAHAGDAVYDRFYGPLLEARFGDRASDVSAAWVLEHCRGERERTRFGRERRARLDGGTDALLEALADAVGRDGVETNARVTALETADGAVESVTVESGGSSRRHAVDALVVATSEARESLVGDPPVPIRTRTCLRLSTTASAPLTDAARVTMVDDAPFGELVAPTVRRSTDADGGHRYYLLDGGRAAAEGLETATIERRWLEALADRFASFDRNDLADVETGRIRQPVPLHGSSITDVAARPPRPETAPEGLYDVTVVRQPQFPHRRVGSALETGLRCARSVADAVRRTPNRRLAERE